MRAITLLVALAALLACVSAHDNDVKLLPLSTVATRAINLARRAVNPPCDYRTSANGVPSPCNGNRFNKLPRVQWSGDLVKLSTDFAALCPTSRNAILPAGLGQTLLVSQVTPDTRTDSELLRDALNQWSAPVGYDGATGNTRGSQGRAYKQIVWAKSTRVGCAVNSACQRGRRVVCTFSEVASATGLPYPILSLNADLSAQFRNSMIEWINRARRAVDPPAREPLRPLVWDDTIAAGAQAWANTQRVRPSTHDPSYTNGEIKFATDSIWANPAFNVVVRWFTLGNFYNHATNTCVFPGGKPGNCGKYTQLVGADITKVGCGIAWNGGVTYVICRFDKSYSNGIDHTIVPYQAR